MTRKSILLFVVLLLLLIAGGAVGVWWYLHGPNEVASAELVPSDTIAFMEIPNGVDITSSYQTSQLKTLIGDPNLKSQIDTLLSEIGPKNVDLIQAFAPNLSGQSFIALTHLDISKPADLGLIAALKPKPGLNRFNDFVEKVKTTYPDMLKEGTTGTGNVEGIDYQWIQGNDAPYKVCVAQVDGWIITAWGENSLKDWIERYQKKATTPSLAQNADYQKSLARVGKSSMAVTYVDYHAFIDLLKKGMAMNPIIAATNQGLSNYLTKKLGAVGGFMIGSSFENGEIKDRFSILIPHQAQVDAGMVTTPCPFETLNFTGPDTHLYWGTSFDFQQYWKNLQEEMKTLGQGNPVAAAMGDPEAEIQKQLQPLGLDLHRNIIDALGSEFSVQVDWQEDAPYPEVGLFVKLKNPDDFRPTIDAIIKATKEATVATGVIREMSSNGRTFVSLKFASGSPITPTITKDGPYFGIFLSENQAVRSFQRDPTIDLTHNADFARQIGDKRNGASCLLFLDTPYLLDRSYRTAMPYLSLASMFSKDLAGMLKGKDLPTDLKWLTPMGPWSAVSIPDDAGATGYSVSGVGNQGIFLAAGLGVGMEFMQSSGMLANLTSALGAPAVPSLGATPPSVPVPDPNATNGVIPAAPAPDAAPAPATHAAPDATAPATPPPTPSAVTPAPAPSPDTNAPPTPTDPNKPQ